MSDQGEKTCPLCMEDMDLTDRQLKPCKCGYEICVWCWHHIMDMAEKDDTEGRCPACRTAYDKEKIVGTTSNCERLVAEINTERRVKSQKAKPKTSDGRKHLSSVRVIQRNLVYIIGIPSNLADEDQLLQHKEYFGQYGKVLKVSIARTAGGAIQHSANNTCSVYITYSKEEEAVRCIQSVHGYVLEDKPLRACFGTTKYCHAWLRNMACSNPDCLYLHDIGSQEDSFTKDEIISAYTRSRVQQITGATNNLQRRSGNTLPPPADDFCISSSASLAKQIVKSVPNNSVSHVKGSPPNGSSGRTIALPAAASWGLRVSNGRPPTPSSACSSGPGKQKPNAYSGSFPAVADVGKKSSETEENLPLHVNGISGPLESLNQYTARDPQPTILDSPADVRHAIPATIASSDHLSSNQYTARDPQPTISDSPADVRHAIPATIASSDHLSCLPTSKDGGVMMPLKITQSIEVDRPASNSSSDTDVSANDTIHCLCPELSSHLGVGHSDLNGSVSNLLSFRSHGKQSVQQYYPERVNDPLTSLLSRKAAVESDGVSVSRELCDWRSESPIPVLSGVCSDGEEDLLALNQRGLRVSETVTSNSSKHSNVCSSNIPGNASSRNLHIEVDETFCPFVFNDSVLSNGADENKLSRTADFGNISESSSLFSNAEKGKHLGRFNGDAVEKTSTADMGESSIISNILSMDFDEWDDSLTSPHNLVKFLNDNDKQHSSLKLPNSLKAQNSNQSRFSFARQEDFGNQGSDLESSFSNIGHMAQKNTVPQDFDTFSSINRDPHFDKLRNGMFVESDTFPSSLSITPPSKLSAPRAQISAPPGFSVPSRPPPPGFSSQERMDQAFESFSGNHFLDNSLLRNQFLGHPTGSFGSVADVELIDPAILAVGKGRLPNRTNNSGLDMRSTFPQHNISGNDPRLQMLMQQPISGHQNLRYPDYIGDRFSPLSDAYSIPSRILDQSQASAFGQLSLQQSRNGHMLNGHWDGWHEVQTGNELSMAELLRNERLGLNKHFPSYEDLKFRLPTSGDIYSSRAFGI